MASQASDQRSTVLVVEDELIIALDVSETVKDLGYRCNGPHCATQAALDAIKESLPDCAILDVMIDDGEVFPVADALTEAGVPIIFHSGHLSPAEVERRYPGAIACAKPCPPDQLISKVNEALGRARTTTH